MAESGSPVATTLEDSGELRVSTLELFFDLVFVFTLTQLTALLEHDVSWESAARVLIIFVVLFWMYGGYAWLTNQVPPNRVARRLLLVAGMAAFLICALAVPEAFGDDGVAFGVGYLLVVLVHAALFAEVYGWAVVRWVPLNVVGALLVITAGYVDGWGKWPLWIAPIALQYATARITQAANDPDRAGAISLRPEHFVERHGLLLIVAFGESVVAVGHGIGEHDLDVGAVLTAVIGLAVVTALWWAYFDSHPVRAEAALAGAGVAARVRMAVNGYFYSYIPMLLGVVTLAAGVLLVVANVDEPAEEGAAVLLGGGVALYLAGTVGLRLTFGIAGVAMRVAAALLALGTLLLGIHVAAIAQLVALALIVPAMLVAERPRQNPTLRRPLA